MVLVKIKIKVQDRDAAEMGIENVNCEYKTAYINPSHVACMYPSTDKHTDEEGTYIEFVGGEGIIAYESMSVVASRILQAVATQ